MTRAERILALLKKGDGLTDREITDRIDGVDELQQPVNQMCRKMATQGIVVRRKRGDGLIGNYLKKTTEVETEGFKISKYVNNSRNIKELESFGFRKAGDWLLEDEKLKFDLRKYSDEMNILYAFLVNGHIVYIGKSAQSLKTRVNLYKNAGRSQKTNLRVNSNLLDALDGGNDVSIYTLVFNVPIFYDDVEIDLAAGLEDGMIRKFDPEWNMRK